MRRSKGEWSHPFYRMMILTPTGTTRDESLDVLRYKGDDDALWDYVPRTPTPSILDTYLKHWDFSSDQHIDTTSVWQLESQNSGGDGVELSLVGWRGSDDAHAYFKPGTAANDHYTYQEKYAGLSVGSSGDADLWFEIEAKATDWANQDLFFGYAPLVTPGDDIGTYPQFGLYVRSVGGQPVISAFVANEATGHIETGNSEYTDSYNLSNDTWYRLGCRLKLRTSTFNIALYSDRVQKKWKEASRAATNLSGNRLLSISDVYHLTFHSKYSGSGTQGDIYLRFMIEALPRNEPRGS